MSTPRRIQLRRTKGWRLPANTVVVARPKRWGNPFQVGKPFTPAEAVEQFRLWCVKHNAEAIRTELRGKNLACWCPKDICWKGHKFGEEHDRLVLFCPKCACAMTRVPCHADVLLEIANR